MEQRKEMMSEEQRQSLENQGLGAALNEAQHQDDEADGLLKIVEPDLPQHWQELQAIVSREAPLANLKEAEVNEGRWLNRAYEQLILDIHPPEGSIMQGKWMAGMTGDPKDILTPLTYEEKLELKHILEGDTLRRTRGRGGWQQKQWKSVHTTTEAIQRDENDDSGRSWLPL